MFVVDKFVVCTQNACNDGVATVAGNLNDGPASLAAVLMTLVQSFSMNTLGTMSMWLNTISSEVDELAVSKHTSQAKELWRVLNVIKDYADPTEKIVSHLFEQAIQHRAELAALQEEKAIEAAIAEEEEKENKGKKKEQRRSQYSRKRSNTMESAESNLSTSDSDESEAVDHVPSPITTQSRKSFLETVTDARDLRASFTKRNIGTLIMKRRSTNIQGSGDNASTIQLSFAVLPHGSHNMPMSIELLEPFFGENINMTCQNLEMILEGDESLEVQGTRYWKEQLNLLEISVAKVKEDIHASLEEKRNFFSFILTVVTVFLAPLTILTGYWGMNFDNMIELDSSSYEILPGVKLLWFVATCVYSLFLALSIHFRVLYSAT